MKKLTLILGTGILLASCSPKSAPVVEEIKGDLPTAELNMGKHILDTKCQKCHATEDVTAYSKEQWDVILPKMAKKARLKAEEEQTLTEYVNWAITQ